MKGEEWIKKFSDEKRYTLEDLQRIRDSFNELNGYEDVADEFVCLGMMSYLVQRVIDKRIKNMVVD